MTILFYLTAIFFSIGQLGRVSFFNQQINLYLYELFLMASLFIIILKYRFLPIKEAWKKYKPIFLFILVLLLSLLIDSLKYSFFDNAVGFLYFFRLTFYFIYFFYLQYYSSKNKKFYKVISNSFIAIAIITILLTFVQYFFYPDLRNLIYQGWDPHLYRTFGVFFDTSIAAAIYGVLFLTVNLPIIKILYLLLISLSFSRSTYIGLMITLIYLSISQKQIIKLLFLILFFISLIIFIPKPSGEGVNLGRLYSIASRVEDYRQGIDLWKNKPIFGYGYNRIRYIKNSDSIHSGATFSSSFLTILVSSGFVGLVTFIWALWSLIKSNKSSLGLIIFLSTVSMFDNVLLHPFILFLLFTNLSDKQP